MVGGVSYLPHSAFQVVLQKLSSLSGHSLSLSKREGVMHTESGSKEARAVHPILDPPLWEVGVEQRLQ